MDRLRGLLTQSFALQGSRYFLLNTPSTMVEKIISEITLLMVIHFPSAVGARKLGAISEMPLAFHFSTDDIRAKILACSLAENTSINTKQCCKLKLNTIS